MIIRRSSTSALIPLLQEQKPVIERVRKNTRSIRESLSSPFDLTANENRRVFSEKFSFLDSNIGDEEFSFDDEIINTFAYRNAMKRLVSKAKAAQENVKLDERHILDEPLINLEELPQTQSELKANSTASSNRQCLAPNMTSTRTTLHDYTVMKDFNPLIPTSIESPSQPTNERHAALASSSTEGSSNDTRAYLGDNSIYPDEVTRQHVRDDEYRETRHLHTLSRKPVQALYRPLQHSFDQSSRPDADTTESLRRKPRSRHARERKDRLAFVVEEQVAREEPHMVPPSSPRTPAGAGENFETCYSNTAYNDLESEQVETRHEYAANSSRGWKERDMDGCLYDHTSNTKASEHGKFGSRFLVEEVSNKGPEYVEEKDFSINQVTYKEEPSEQEKITSSSLDVETRDRDSKPGEEKEIFRDKVIHKDEIRPRKVRRGSNRERIDGKRSPNAKEIAFAGLPASALKYHERGQSSGRRYQNKRVQDSNEESGQGLSAPSNTEPKPGGKIASKTSIANPKMLEMVENAIRNLILPELTALKQEQSMKKRDQLREPSRPDVIASPVAKSSKHANVLDTPESRTILLNRDRTTTDIRRCAGRIRDSGSKDGNPVTKSNIEPGHSHRKIQDDISTHASHRSQSSLLREYFEGGSGGVHLKPTVRVKITPRKVEDSKEIVQTQIPG